MSAANIETVSTSADKAKLVAVAVLVVASIAGFYGLSAKGVIVQWLVLLLGLAAAVVVFALSLPGRQLSAFGNDAWREVKKVVWPTRKRVNSNDVVCVCLCGDHGAVSLVDG